VKRIRNRLRRPRARPRVACLLILSLVAVPALAAPEGAAAATYTVYSCKRPDGLAAGLDGWTRSFVGETKRARTTAAAGATGSSS
jgi:hypothetical protein